MKSNGNYKIKVLLAENDKEYSVLIQKILIPDRYHLVVFDDGTETINYLNKTDVLPDILLVSLSLPNIDGLTILETIKISGINIASIVLMDTIDTEQIRQSFSMGAMDFIPKTAPIGDVLQEMISNVFRIKQNIEDKDNYERLLHESESKFNTAFYSNPSTMVITRFSDGIFLDVNKIFINKLGYKKDEVIGLTSLDIDLFVYSHERDEFRKILLKDKSVRNFEMSIHTKAKEVRIGLFSAEIITLGGEPCLLSIMTDITERKLAEEKLKQSEKINRTLVENVVHGLAIIQRGRYIYYNANAVKILGYTQEELTQMNGISRLRMIYKSDRTLVIQSFKGLKNRSLDLSRIEFRIKRKDGKFIWIENYVSLIEYEGIPAIHQMFLDISKQKKDTNKLIHQGEKLRRISENMTDIIILCDSEGYVQYISPSIKNIFSSAPEQLIGKLLYDVIHVENPERFKTNYEECVESQKGCTLEIKVIQDPDTAIWLEMRSNVIISDGIVKGIVISATDISRRKVVEEMIEKHQFKIEQQKIQLEDLIQSKDKFLSIIAHDLKNPVANVMGFSELLLKNYTTNSAEKNVEIIAAIYESASRNLELLQNLLEWARSQRGKMDFSPSNLKVIDIINDNFALFKEIAQKKKLRLVSDISENVIVHADYNMFTTIIRNLVSNAIKFTPENGEIRLTAKPTQDDFVEISVSDTGIGMSPEDVQKLFKLDVNTSGVGTSGEKGTGIGLVLCKDFINRHKGTIWCTSLSGKGSTFSFTLPLNSQNQ